MTGRYIKLKFECNIYISPENVLLYNKSNPIK